MITGETIARVRQSLADVGITADLIKATFNQANSPTSGLTYYDLEAGAKRLYPVITPLRNMIPRVAGAGGTATNWRAITSINTNTLPLGVPEGTRGGVIAVSTQDFTAKYVGLGLETSVSFEADLAARGFDDVRSRAAQSLLESVFIQEEQLDLGGNGSVALGTTPTVTGTPSNTGGALAAATYHIRAVALTLAAYQRASMTAGIPTTQAVVSADGGTTTNVNGGPAIVSVDATAVVASGTTGSIAAALTAVPGAVAYAWFIGSGATNGTLAGITTVNAFTFTTVPAAGSPATGFADTVGTNFNADRSTNALVYDGLISIIAKPGSNGYFVTSDNATLTSDSAGGIVELDTDFKAFWDTYRLSPDMVLVNAQQLKDITNKVIAGGGVPLFRFTMDGQRDSPAMATATAGAVVGTYLNKYTMSGGNLVKIVLHPNVPPGTVVYVTSRLPYPLSDVTNVLQVKTRREYYQLEWPLRTRQYETGVYVDQVLQCYAPFAFGMRCNIKAG